MDLKSSPLCGSLFFAMVFMAWGTGPRLNAGDDPVLTTEPTGYEFGEIFSGEILDKEILLKNEGKGDLFIKKIEFSCGCTIPQILLSNGEKVVPSFEKSESFVVLKSGEWAKVKLLFQSIGHFGKVRHRMDIYSNDPKGQIRNIPIDAHIKRALKLDPATAEFGIIDKSQATSRTIRVLSNGVGEFDITGIENLPGFLSFSIEKPEETDIPTRLLTLSYKGKADVGKHAFSLKVQVSNETVKNFALYTELRVFPSIVFKHNGKRIYELIDLGLLHRGQEEEAVIEIINGRLDQPYLIKKVDCQSNCDPPVETVLITKDHGMRYEVILKVSPEVKKRIVRGRITLFSDHPDLPQGTILFRGLYR